MKLVALLLALLPSVAGAKVFDRPGAPLAELLGEARRANKPLLVEFSAVWCKFCKKLEADLARPEQQRLLGAYLFEIYDAERGEGSKAALRYGVTGYPTLLVLDWEGSVIARQSGYLPAELTPFLAGSATLRDEQQLLAAVAAKADDLDSLWLLARRAQGRGDGAAARGWLEKIEKGDASEGRVQAARAGWERLQSELRERQGRDVVAAVKAYVAAYPAEASDAIDVLAAAGADRATLERALGAVVDAASDPEYLNAYAYQALSFGALDVALRAAEKLVAARRDADGLDTLAEVVNYRGDKARALAVENEALALPGLSPAAAADLRRNLARFEKGEKNPSLKPPGKLREPTDIAPAAEAVTAEKAGRKLFAERAAEIGAACAARRRGLSEAYVRIRLGTGSFDKIEILEPSASPALRACLDRAIRAVKLPADSMPTKVVLSIALD